MVHDSSEVVTRHVLLTNDALNVAKYSFCYICRWEISRLAQYKHLNLPCVLNALSKPQTAWDNRCFGKKLYKIVTEAIVQ